MRPHKPLRQAMLARRASETSSQALERAGCTRARRTLAACVLLAPAAWALSAAAQLRWFRFAERGALCRRPNICGLANDWKAADPTTRKTAAEAKMAVARLTKLREILQSRSLAAFVCPTDDAHLVSIAASSYHWVFLGPNRGIQRPRTRASPAH